MSRPLDLSRLSSVPSDAVIPGTPYTAVTTGTGVSFPGALQVSGGPASCFTPTPLIPPTTPWDIITIPGGLTPTQQQQRFLQVLCFTNRNIILQARAGCGKSSAIVMGVRAFLHYFPHAELLVCAYNKEIQVHMSAILKALGYDWREVDCLTVHSMGKRLLQFIYRPTVEEKKTWQILDELAAPETLSHPLRVYGQQIVQLVSLGKQAAVGYFPDLPIDDRETWHELADHYDLDGYDSAVDIDAVITQAQKIYKMSLDITSIIDFDDMVLLPLIKGLRVKYTKDVILGDEIQDWSRARQALVKKFIRPHTGRLIGVGDDRQAIYGFCHPAGTLVMTPKGNRAIESLSVGSPVVISSTAGETEGWGGSKQVRAVHEYSHNADLLRIRIDGTERVVSVTLNHRVPVRIGGAPYYTYIMRRCGVWRVGSCKAYTSGQFMLQLRKKTEKADSVWILAAHGSKEAAREAERDLLVYVKGRTFSPLTDEEVRKLPTDEYFARKLLRLHGRSVDHPLISDIAARDPVRISRRGAFVTEAFNLFDGMEMAFYSKEQEKISKKRGKSRQRLAWTAVTVDRYRYCGKVYGITVDHTMDRLIQGRVSLGLPLYFAGFGDSRILVHNSGADAEAMTRLTREMDAVTLPLSVTWRCPKSVVKLAQRIVPDIEAAEEAPEGEVLHQADLVTGNEVSQSGGRSASYIHLEDLTPGQDCILCRNTAPLIPLAYSLIRAGIPAKVEGRKIGEGLASLVQRWRVKYTSELISRLEDYQAREIEKYKLKGQDQKVSEVEDRVATLLEIIKEVNRRGRHDIESVLQFIRSLFDDQARGVVILATYHRSKGREWDRVFLFEHYSRCPSKAARQAWQREQERNLAYVSFTRAKKTLVFIG